MTGWTVPATVLEVVDGDTIRVRLDLGWHIQYDTLVRIDGINAPELHTTAGKAARKYLADVLFPGAPVTVCSKLLLGSREKYGRVLADVDFTPAGAAAPVSVAADMLATGHARPWDGKGARP